jgi:nicotinate-nucleotide pyrophosphorylase (carboxylating)
MLVMDQTDLNALPLGEFYARLAATGLVRRLLELARDEDLGPGSPRDVTSASCIPADQSGVAAIVARVEGVVSGLAALPTLVEVLAPDVRIRTFASDGQWVKERTTLAEVRGPMRQVLALERTTLNLIGRLCGVATKTAQFVAAMGDVAADGGRARLYDTRKTTPGLRVLEKYAVRCGGGHSHRMGLHDAVLIKDNHIAGVSVAQLPEYIENASARARALRPAPTFVEVEVDTLEQFAALLTLPTGVVDIILLDNMTTDMLRVASGLRDAQNPTLQLEASGGVRMSTVHEIARTGVDRISVGALTHSAVSLDVAMDIEGGHGVWCSPA